MSWDEGSDRSSLPAASSPLNRGQSGHESSLNRPHAILADVTSALRDLYELMQSYGPSWYTESLDTQLRRTLTVAEAALRVSIDRRQVEADSGIEESGERRTVSTVRTCL